MLAPTGASPSPSRTNCAVGSMLYQLLCLARPMAAGELSSMMQKVGSVVFNSGGVVTEVKSYGRQHLAYKIRGVHGKYEQVRAGPPVIWLVWPLHVLPASLTGPGCPSCAHAPVGRAAQARCSLLPHASRHPRPTASRTSTGLCPLVPPRSPHTPAHHPILPILSPHPCQANIWELEFAVSPEALKQINHELHVDEAVLRYVVLRRDALPKLPAPKDMYHRHEKYGKPSRSARRRLRLLQPQQPAGRRRRLDARGRHRLAA